ncbi:MAG: CrcB protein [Hyphomonadaceae bacterium]|nr:MAG: CrcB protein [Hyphomonadaceae bacterium]KAF0186220.1 MAG: CrcB protein [Hyphomonadaceae bacterium]
MQLVLVFLGAGIGGVSRFLFGKAATQILGAAFPYGTLGVNVIGGFCMGIAAAILAKNADNSGFIHYFVMVGILGGFTTFSAFSLDVVKLAQSGQMTIAALYVGASVVLSIGAVLLGMALMHKIV